MADYNKQSNEYSIDELQKMDIERSDSLDYVELKKFTQQYLDKISYNW